MRTRKADTSKGPAAPAALQMSDASYFDAHIA